MSTPERTAGDVLLEFRQAVTDALQNFDLWVIFDDPEHEARRPIFQRFADYFLVVQHAHLSTAVLSLYRLFETRTDTVNFDRVVEAVERERPGLRGHLRGTESEIACARSTWRKIAVLRNEVFAHRKKVLTVDDSFSKAGLTIAEVREMIVACQGITEEIQRHHEGTVPAWPFVHEDAFLGMLAALDDTLERE